MEEKSRATEDVYVSISEISARTGVHRQGREPGRLDSVDTEGLVLTGRLKNKPG